MTPDELKAAIQDALNAERTAQKAQADAEYRHSILGPEIMRHERSASERKEVPATIVPRLHPRNTMAFDRSTPREHHERILGARIGKPRAQWFYGKLIEKR